MSNLPDDLSFDHVFGQLQLTEPTVEVFVRLGKNIDFRSSSVGCVWRAQQNLLAEMARYEQQPRSRVYRGDAWVDAVTITLLAAS